MSHKLYSKGVDTDLERCTSIVSWRKQTSFALTMLMKNKQINKQNKCYTPLDWLTGSR